MASNAGTSPSPISLLPSEVLVLVIRFFPVAVRLNVLASVCQRWRSVALRSILTFKWTNSWRREKKLPSALLSRLVCLTDLRIHPRVEPLVLPSTLRRLTISKDAWPAHRVSSQEKLNLYNVGELQHFDSTCEDEVLLDTVVHALNNCSNSLTSLRLTNIPANGSLDLVLWSTLASVHLPCLVSLDLQLSLPRTGGVGSESRRGAESLHAFFSQHASQLTSLTVLGSLNEGTVVHRFLSHPFPLLQRFHFHTVQSSTNLLSNFLACTSTLTRLTLERFHEEHIRRLVLPAHITAVDVVNCQAPRYEATLPNLVTLTDFAISKWRSNITHLHVFPAPQKNDPTVSAALQQHPNLRSFSSPGVGLEATPAWVSAHLRRVALHRFPADESKQYNVLREFLKRCTSLRRLAFRPLPLIENDDSLDLLSAFLKDVQQQYPLCKIVLMHDYEDIDPVQLYGVVLREFIKAGWLRIHV